MPYINSIQPNSGDRGDRFTVTILGDGFTHVVGIDFGAGITDSFLSIPDDGTIRVKISIAPDAVSGPRDVTLTDVLGASTIQHGGFTVL